MAATKTRRSAALRLVEAPPDPLDQQGSGKGDDDQEERVSDEDPEHEDQPGQRQADLAVAGHGDADAAATTTVANQPSVPQCPLPGRPPAQPEAPGPTRAGAGLLMRLIVSARSRSSVLGDING